MIKSHLHALNLTPAREREQKKEKPGVPVNDFKKAQKLIENSACGRQKERLKDRQTDGRRGKQTNKPRQRAAAHLTFPTNARRRSSGLASFHTNVNSIKSYQAAAAAEGEEQAEGGGGGGGY